MTSGCCCCPPQPNDLPCAAVCSRQQILIQLRNFSRTAKQAQLNAMSKPKPRAVPLPPPSSVGLGGSAPSMRDVDLSSILGTPTSDTPGIDSSVGAIVKRVALLAVTLIVLFIALFFVGLESFPK